MIRVNFYVDEVGRICDVSVQWWYQQLIGWVRYLCAMQESLVQIELENGHKVCSLVGANYEEIFQYFERSTGTADYKRLVIRPKNGMLHTISSCVRVPRNVH